MTGLNNLVLLFFFQSLVSYYKCFYIDTVGNTGETCSTVFCSNDKISNMYETSKFLLTEIEDILYDLRNEKASHQMETEYNKQLDYETILPQTDNYEDIYFSYQHDGRNGHLNDFSDAYFDHQMESDMREPVPFINMFNSDEEIQGDEFNGNVENDTHDNLSSEEEIDRLLSKIHKLDDENTNDKTERKSFMKRYFR